MLLDFSVLFLLIFKLRKGEWEQERLGCFQRDEMPCVTECCCTRQIHLLIKMVSLLRGVEKGSEI